MGSNIFVYVERFSSSEWKFVEPIYSYADGRGDVHRTWNPYKQSRDIHRPNPEQRHYLVYAFLSGYRNYEDVTPQFPDRGLPDDTTIDQHTDYDGDIGFTWFTLREALDAPWKTVGLDDCGFYVWCKSILLPLLKDPESVRITIGFDC